MSLDCFDCDGSGVSRATGGQDDCLSCSGSGLAKDPNEHWNYDPREESLIPYTT